MDMNIKNKLNILFVTVIAACTTLSFTGCAKAVGKQITKDRFKDFYYTYSTTVNPPEFRRYRFYIIENALKGSRRGINAPAGGANPARR